MSKTYISCDNGVSGSVAFIKPNGEYDMIHTPIRKCLNYTKKVSWINRLDYKKMYDYLKPFETELVYVLLERPMVSPQRWNASLSAVRCYEATLSVFDFLKFSYDTIDSKEWQKEMLPSGVHAEDLKTASLQVGQRLFPNLVWKGFKDADSLLMAEYARRHNL